MWTIKFAQYETRTIHFLWTRTGIIIARNHYGPVVVMVISQIIGDVLGLARRQHNIVPDCVISAQGGKTAQAGHTCKESVA